MISTTRLRAYARAFEVGDVGNATKGLLLVASFAGGLMFGQLAMAVGPLLH